MTELRYIGPAEDGFLVQESGSIPQFYPPHVFITTFGIEALETHVLDDAEVQKITENYVECANARYPFLTVRWPIYNGEIQTESGRVRMNDRTLLRASPGTGGMEAAKAAYNDG